MMKKLLYLTIALAGHLSVASCQEPPVEMLQNGDFEAVVEGQINEWSGTPIALSSSQEHTTQGTRSLKLSSDKAGFDPIAAQNITKFEIGKTYRLQYQARAGKFGEEYRVYVGVWDDTQAVADKKWVAGVDTQWRQGLENWQKVSVDFTVEKPANRLMIVMQLKGPGTIWFDQISLQEARAKQDRPAIAPFVGSPNFVQITPEKTFRVQGKPFFPIMMWGWQPNTEEAMASAREMGFNIVAPTHIDSLGPDGFRIWLDAARKYELMVKATADFSLPESQVETVLPQKLAAMRKVIEMNKNHPAIFTYGIADEPAWAGSSVDAFAAGAHLIREIDPNRPIFVNHAPRNTIAELQRFNKYVDIAGSDIYPIGSMGLGRHSDLPNPTMGVVGDETTKNSQAVSDAKPIIQTLQAFGWADNQTGNESKVPDNPFPTETELRFMTYHTIVRGATSAAFFQDHRYKTLRQELKPIVRELHALSDVLAGGSVLPRTTLSGANGLEWIAKSWKGSTVLIAVNPTGKPIRSALQTSNWPGATDNLKVLFENRNVAWRDGKFEDDFAPWAVHIYTNAADEKTLLRAFQPLKVGAAPAANPNQKPTWQAELEKLAPAGRENLALAARGVKPIASSELGALKASWLNDGDRWIAQWNDATHYNYPDWAGLEFPTPVEMARVVIFSHEIPIFGMPAPDGIRDFDVQVEHNGEWKTVRSIKDNTQGAVAVDFNPTLKANKIRVLISATNGANDWSRIREIEVYGPPA